jgi:broad-specificity NMP kinase
MLRRLPNILVCGTPGCGKSSLCESLVEMPRLSSLPLKHVVFGNLAKELKKVVQLETADILFLGCQSSNHPIIATLGKNFPCAVLGIPHCIDE